MKSTGSKAIGPAGRGVGDVELGAVGKVPVGVGADGVGDEEPLADVGGKRVSVVAPPPDIDGFVVEVPFASAELGSVAASSEMETGCVVVVGGAIGVESGVDVGSRFGRGTGFVRPVFNGIPAGTCAGGLFDVGNGGAAGLRISRLDRSEDVAFDRPDLLLSILECRSSVRNVPTRGVVSAIGGVSPGRSVPGDVLPSVVAVPFVGERNRAVVPLAASNCPAVGTTFAELLSGDCVAACCTVCGATLPGGAVVVPPTGATDFGAALAFGIGAAEEVGAA